MTQDDLLYRFRLRVFAMAGELGNVRAACRAMGIHPSTYYRWKRQLDRYGPEILRPRERRVPRMANATSPLLEQRVVAFALGRPGFGPTGSPPRWPSPAGAPSGSGQRVWRMLRRHGLQIRSRRYGLVAGYPLRRPRSGPPGARAPPGRGPPRPAGPARLPCIGRLSGTKGRWGSPPASTWPRPPPGPPCRSPVATPGCLDQPVRRHRRRRHGGARLAVGARHGDNA